MSSDFINGDRSPIPSNKPPHFSENSPRLVAQSKQLIESRVQSSVYKQLSGSRVQSSGVNNGSRIQSNQNKDLNGVEGQHVREQSPEAINGVNHLSSQRRHSRPTNLVTNQDLVSSVNGNQQQVEVVGQLLQAPQNIRGNNQWRPRAESEYVNPITGVRNGSPNLIPIFDSNQNLGVYPNLGLYSYSMGNVHGNLYPVNNYARNSNFELEFPPISGRSQNISSNGIMAGNQSSVHSVEIGQSSNSHVQTHEEQNSGNETQGQHHGGQGMENYQAHGGVLCNSQPQRPTWLDVMEREGNQNKDWSHLFKIEKNRYALEKTIMNKLNNKFFIKKDVIKRGSKNWEGVVVGFFFDSMFGFRYVENFLRRRWILKGGLKINADKEMFFLRFSNDEDRKMVLEEGPIFMHGKVFVLREWNANIEMEKRGCKTLPVWTKLYDIPKFLWNKEGFSNLASCMGLPLFTDRNTMDMKKMGFARICVEVDTNFTFPSKLEFTTGEMDFDIDVEYEWKPPKCRNCCSFGHHFHNCKEPINKENVEGDVQYEIIVGNGRTEASLSNQIVDTIDGNSVDNAQINGGDKETVQDNNDVSLIPDRDEEASENYGYNQSEKAVSNQVDQSLQEDIIVVEQGTDGISQGGKGSDKVVIQERLAAKLVEENVDNVEGNVSFMGKSSEHFKQKSNVEAEAVGTNTKENQKKTGERSDFTKGGDKVVAEEASVQEKGSISTDNRGDIDKTEKRASKDSDLNSNGNKSDLASKVDRGGGGRKLLGKNEVIHIQKERERNRTRSGVVLHNDFSRQFYEDSEDYDEEGASQPDEDNIPFVDGVPVVFKAYPANNSANKVKAVTTNKNTVVTPNNVKVPNKVNNNGKRPKGHKRR